MVAYNPRSPDDERPSLPPAIAAQLRSALSARWSDSEGNDSVLESALVAAACDARQRGLRPEQLLIALKRIEEDVADALEVVNTQDRDRFRIWLVGVCMRAFFGTDQRPEG